MQTLFNTQLKEAGRYRSPSQRVRFLSEYWVSKEIFCPHCGGENLSDFKNNRPVADFYCENCDEEYELKSKKNTIGSTIMDGAYKTMVERLQSHNNPNFFFLSYNPQNHSVKDFIVIPKHFFVPSIIKKRKPLPPSARRSGWVGCTILLKNIPHSGRISYIKDGQIESKEKVLKKWQKTLFLRDAKKTELRGWLLDIMNYIDILNQKEFTLQDMYAFEGELSKKHPKNKNIKEKIRQQLQFLRDKGHLVFLSRGKYRVK